MSRAVILLKSQPKDANDPYIRHFLSSNLRPHFIEVLESGLSNEYQLKGVVAADPIGYNGVVLTSNRAAEAWINAIDGMEKPGNWVNVPFYVVGEATSRTLKNFVVKHPSHISENLIVGAQSGNSESLARFVLDDLQARDRNGKILYLTGDKNRDVFNRIMSEGGIDVENLRVYETMPARDLGDRVDRIAKEIERGKYATATWIACFAPSSSDFALQHLRRHFWWLDTEGSGKNSGNTGMRARLAAIGPTTATFLRDERHLRVDAVALKPDPEQLVQAILDVDEEGLP